MTEIKFFSVYSSKTSIIGIMRYLSKHMVSENVSLLELFKDENFKPRMK